MTNKCRPRRSIHLVGAIYTDIPAAVCRRVCVVVPNVCCVGLFIFPSFART